MSTRPVDPQPLVAEELLLLLLDDESGRLEGSWGVDTAVGGALLVELALGGHVETRERSGWFAEAQVHVVEHVAPPADPILREAHRGVAEKERSAQDLVDRLGRAARESLLDRLVDRGLVRRDEGKVLGLFPRTRWPAVDTTHEAEVRAQLARVLLDGDDPDPRSGALVGLLSALDLPHKVIERDDVPARSVRKRATAIAEDGGWAPEAVADAIQASQAAMVAVIAATSTTAATSSG